MIKEFYRGLRSSHFSVWHSLSSGILFSSWSKTVSGMSQQFSCCGFFPWLKWGPISVNATLRNNILIFFNFCIFFSFFNLFSLCYNFYFSPRQVDFPSFGLHVTESLMDVIKKIFVSVAWPRLKKLSSDSSTVYITMVISLQSS